MTTNGSRFLRSPLWDGIFILSGVWLLPAVILLGSFPGPLLLFSLAATAMLWLSHRIATFFTIFCTPSYRALIFEEPSRFIVLPGLVLASSVAFMLSPVPSGALTRLQILGTLFLLFNTYHFGVQHFGVLTIYRLRAGQKYSDAQRDGERFDCLALGGVLVLAGQLLHGADVVRESMLSSVVLADQLLALRLAGLAAVAVCGARLIRRELRVQPHSLPKLIYEGALVAQSACAFILPPLPFLILWAVQHWLVSVGLALHMAENGTRQSDRSPPGRWHSWWNTVNRTPWRSGGVLVALSALLAPILIVPTRAVSGTTSHEIFASMLEWFIRNESIALVCIGLNFGTVFCHFLYDRAVFRFSHAPTRAVSGSLLFGPRAQ